MKLLLLSTSFCLLATGCGQLPRTLQVPSSPTINTAGVKQQADNALATTQQNLRQEMTAFSVPKATPSPTVAPPEQYALPTLAPALYQQRAIGGKNVPMVLQRSNQSVITMSIADPNTARSAYGLKLRLYEVHLAKMVEVTNYLCRDEGLSNIQWLYKVAGKDRGLFTITCDTAAQITQSYGKTQRPEWTVIQTSGQADWRQAVPVLKIADAKVDRWIVFCQQFYPDNNRG